MADLGKTNAEWSRILEREFALTILAPLRALREVRDRFDRDRTQVRVVNDPAINAVAVTLSGINTGINTAPDGRLFARITGGPSFTVSLYRAAGGLPGDLVAQGTGTASTTVNLLEQSSSGISGTWTFNAAPSTTIDDSLQLETVLDFPALLQLVYTQTDGVEDDKDSRRVLQAAYDTIVGQFNSAIGTIEAAAAAMLLGDENNPTGRGNDFAQANETTLAAETENRDQSGNISRTRTGLFEVLRASMADETVGSTQFVRRRVVTASAGVPASTNQGQGTIAAHTPREKAQAGRLTLRCTEDTIGQERFDGYLYLDGTDRRTAVTGLQVGRTWSGPNGVGPLLLQRTLAKTGDVGVDTDLGPITGFAATGETSSNTNDGVLYWEIAASGANWDLSFYNSPNLTPASLVSRVLAAATGASFVAEPVNGSGLTITGTIGSAPTTLTTGTLDLQVFKSENNVDGSPDSFTITFQVTEAGLVQTLLAKHFSTDGAELNSTAPGGETVDDDYVRANTFASFSVEDN